MNLSIIKISKYENTFSILNTEVSLVEELEMIRDGFYKEKILKCRKFVADGNIAAYKTAKKSLPALTFSGSFTGAHKKDNLKSYSRLIVIDIDGIETDIDIIKRKLMGDAHSISTWISPSGKGLKVLIEILIDHSQHKTAFDQILNYFKQNYNLDIDKTGSDLCRLCYVSFDQELEIKTQFKPFVVLPEVKKVALLGKTTKLPVVFKDDHGQKLNSAYNKRMFVKIYKFLQSRKLSITEKYDDWYRVALAISNSFNTELGKRYFLRLSSLDESYDEYKCLELLDYCYRNKRAGAISFRTILHMAKAHGFNE